MQCGMKNTQATFEANTDCVWLADEEECNLSDEVGNEIGTELQAGVVLLLGPMMICGFSDPTDCPADTCVVYGDTCSVSDAAVDSAYEDASVAELMKMSFKCSAQQSENSCEANPECTWSMQDERIMTNPWRPAVLATTPPHSLSPSTACTMPKRGFSPISSTSDAVTAEAALLGAALAVGLAAFA